MALHSTSAIGMAFAGKSASVDIPKPRDGVFGLDIFTDVPATTATKTKKKHGMLPTPPNSISPNLPPQSQPIGNTLHDPASPPSVPGDMDLRDAPENSHVLNAEALDSLGDLDSAGAITPGLLAKHHLPEILLAHGPLAIRHVMGHLTTSVPGFSRITSAKARRLVVAALEGRGSSADAGGVDGDVIFEKVGWGRWDARIKGQPPRHRQPANMSPPASLPSSYSHAAALQIPGGQTSWPNASERLGSSVTANSAAMSHSDMDYDDPDMIEHEADKMSLDGDGDDDDAQYSSSEAPDPMLDCDMGDGDVTDEEDWASIGAAALRARSLPSASHILSGSAGRLYQPIASYSTSRKRSLTPAVPPPPPLPTTTRSTMKLAKTLPVNDSQERAAIEALLSLGSM